jgi:hypothetical protein
VVAARVQQFVTVRGDDAVGVEVLAAQGDDHPVPLNDFPTAKPTYDFYDTVGAGLTAIATLAAAQIGTYACAHVLQARSALGSLGHAANRFWGTQKPARYRHLDRPVFFSSGRRRPMLPGWCPFLTK